ncbi:MAG TPA: prepilin-type N-terminal cleavage/methylation domain-containing protein, partial [Gemmatimonadaceae bacterium]|nr:prepilin-type N-terminal cleavage/methylation domain-containing protein [Gemmatimonadaceae bacterium]
CSASHVSPVRKHDRSRHVPDPGGSLMRVNTKKGFTLIELLIVIVIIGILAAIAIPKFASTKDKAKLASVKTDLRNYMTSEEAYFSDKAAYGTFANVQSDLKFTLSPGNTHTTEAVDPGGWKLTVVNNSISGGTFGCTMAAGDEASTDSLAGVIVCDQTK